MKNNKGFVVSAELYPLLVLFLALIMGLLAMTDTRKRILDKMKLEISDSIFAEATCSCDTMLNKLNYLIKNGVGGSGAGGGGAAIHVSGGGGGSSYISGHAGCIAVDSNASPKVQIYSTIDDSVSYTGYKFTNTVMVDGNGYEWKTSRTSIIYMPTFNGTGTMNRNTGNGYAKITYLGQ